MKDINKFGFLFGAGAEIAYGFPSGGKFALSIFRHDSSDSKRAFKEMRDKVDTSTSYAGNWLPKGFLNKSISSFGKSAYCNIIKDTIEHNRGKIIQCINSFDAIAKSEISNLKGRFDVDKAIFTILEKDVHSVNLSQVVSFTEEFSSGNNLFSSSYFSALLLIYKNKDNLNPEDRSELGKILLSIMQLLVGSLGESLARKINDGIFAEKDEEIDLFDDLGDLIHIDYSSTGLAGIEYLMEPHRSEETDDAGKQVLLFARATLENIYSMVMDYKSLIDSNWHYLYSPQTDWAKFCKICIFLLNTRNYIIDLASRRDRGNRSGYYHLLKSAIVNRMLEVTAIATTNYTPFISEILGEDIAFLNGSTELWYDPYINKIGERDKLSSGENHIIVPLMFTQSGTKPMTSISMSQIYVEAYRKWEESDAIVAIGFSFSVDDEHINGIIRTLVDDKDKKLIIVVLDKYGTRDAEVIKREFSQKIKISRVNNISIIRVDENGQTWDSERLELWTEHLQSWSFTQN